MPSDVNRKVPPAGREDVQAAAVRLANATPFDYDDILTALDILMREDCSLSIATTVVSRLPAAGIASATTAARSMVQWRRVNNR